MSDVLNHQDSFGSWIDNSFLIDVIEFTKGNKKILVFTGPTGDRTPDLRFTRPTPYHLATEPAVEFRFKIPYHTWSYTSRTYLPDLHKYY